MKKIAILLVLGIILPAFALWGTAAAGTPVKQVQKVTPTEVYYFHMTRRCATCQAVETVTEAALKENFSDQMKNGQVTFKSVNVEDKANKNLAKKLKVSGQSLLVVNGADRVDITDKGFLYANSDPDKLKDVIKSTVEKLNK